jgi:hypothetical protein
VVRPPSTSPGRTRGGCMCGGGGGGAARSARARIRNTDVGAGGGSDVRPTDITNSSAAGAEPAADATPTGVGVAGDPAGGAVGALTPPSTPHRQPEAGRGANTPEGVCVDPASSPFALPQAPLSPKGKPGKVAEGEVDDVLPVSFRAYVAAYLYRQNGTGEDLGEDVSCELLRPTRAEAESGVRGTGLSYSLDISLPRALRFIAGKAVFATMEEVEFVINENEQVMHILVTTEQWKDKFHFYEWCEYRAISPNQVQARRGICATMYTKFPPKWAADYILAEYLKRSKQAWQEIVEMAARIDEGHERVKPYLEYLQIPRGYPANTATLVTPNTSGAARQPNNIAVATDVTVAKSGGGGGGGGDDSDSDDDDVVLLPPSSSQPERLDK